MRLMGAKDPGVFTSMSASTLETAECELKSMIYLRLCTGRKLRVSV